MATAKKTYNATIDYKKLKLEEMKAYIEEFHNDEESKKAFLEAAYEKVSKITYETVMENGEPKKIKCKDGKERPQKKRRDKGGRKEKRFSYFKAKSYFYKTYKDEIDFLNAPTGVKRVSEARELFADWE